MIKEEYIKGLKEFLEENEASDIDKIIEDVTRKYEIGENAGLSDEEIINDLGGYESYLKRNKTNNSKYMNLIVKDVFSSDIYIRRRDEDGVDIRISKDLQDKLEVEVNDEGIFIEPIKNRNYRNLRHTEITIIIGPNINFKKTILTTVNGDFDIDDIESETIHIETVSGDFDIKTLKCKDASISAVSGDVNIENFYANDCSIKVISGDVECDYCEIDSLITSSISGDITLTGKVRYSKGSSISGDITINKM